jgi:hypothetical protein
MSSSNSLALSLGKLFGIDTKSSDEQEKKQSTAIANIKKLAEENQEAIEKINDEGKDAPKDITIWYSAPNPITNFKDNNEKGDSYINTYSTYRPIYGSKESLDSKKPLTNSGIKFFETYIENDSILNATPGQENYSTFTINIGNRSVSGTLYGLADKKGFWPKDAIVLGTIPNNSVFLSESAKNDDLLPYNYIRFKTYSEGLRSVDFSVNKIGKNDPLGPELGNDCDGLSSDAPDADCTLE